VETIGQIIRLHPDRIYFSFSTTINARLDRLEALIEATPDDRLLIESDYNDVRRSEARLWEILGVVCQAKGWSKEKAVRVLEANWRVFSREGQ
jgi:Tat protein secretion system quality control protein TatD with DNase activity